MAMTEQGPGDGTLEVVPLVSEAMAYVLLRPFQHDVPVHQLCGVNDSGSGRFTTEGINVLCEGLKGSAITSLKCARPPQTHESTAC